MTPPSAIPREHPSGLPYRPCVGVMLVNPVGLVFTGQRLDQMVEAWQMPQGGIDPGEDPYETALRELWEETGDEPARHNAGVALL
jgi:putative (di)nucleoside polyphosphate hydrolase